jgi:hypothetical protein
MSGVKDKADVLADPSSQLRLGRPHFAMPPGVERLKT